MVPRPEAGFTARPYGRGRDLWGMVKHQYEMMRDLRRMVRHRWDKVVDSPHATGKIVVFSFMVAGTLGAHYDYQTPPDLDQMD